MEWEAIFCVFQVANKQNLTREDFDMATQGEPQ